MIKNLTITETNLVNGLQANSHEAFALLYENYAPALLGIIFKIVQEREEAENLLQDSFVKIWGSIGQYDHSKGRLFTWLVAVCRHTAINYLRAKGRKPVLEIQTGASGVYMHEMDTIGDNGLKTMVFKLAPAYRDIVHLLYFWGHTQKEAAKILNLPLGTVKTRTRKALQLLRQQCTPDK